MKYEVIRACMIRGKSFAVGNIIDLDDDMAKQMMAIGRIVPYHDPIVEDRAIGFSEATKPRKRAKAKVKDQEGLEDNAD
jgi:hypothetical protein